MVTSQSELDKDSDTVSRKQKKGSIHISFFLGPRLARRICINLKIELQINMNTACGPEYYNLVQQICQ